ncbi:nucleolar protein 11-like [Protopterus annectens]|uniref:nucleolar protein 11-like n=1 Tax=Protopterus annectens TaxID=7888 RepID=UPI001CF9E97F|nr:nucleolar protein 11-like [Protopterus annectens]
MATFCEGFTLFALPSGQCGETGGLLGIEPGPEDDSVIVTDSGRTVTVYKVSDQKPLGSWTVKQGQVVTSPAVYNSKTGEYVLVYDHKVLRLWKDEDANLEKTFKATLSAEVYRIHTLPNTETVVLFRRGAVRPLDVLLEAPQQEIKNVISEEEVIRLKVVPSFRMPEIEGMEEGVRDGCLHRRQSTASFLCHFIFLMS